MRDDFTERWLIDWADWYARWISRSAIGYPSSTQEYRAAHGQGRSLHATTIVPKIDKPKHVTVVDRIITGADETTKKAVYYAYQFHLPMVKLKESWRETMFVVDTGLSGRTYWRKIRSVKEEIRQKA
ncbi:MAG: hypothetical protein RPU52_02535 [Candidatus Sedimenticola sp. (ex Thyasira tokunagai)]